MATAKFTLPSNLLRQVISRVAVKGRGVEQYVFIRAEKGIVRFEGFREFITRATLFVPTECKGVVIGSALDKTLRIVAQTIPNGVDVTVTIGGTEITFEYPGGVRTIPAGGGDATEITESPVEERFAFAGDEWARIVRRVSWAMAEDRHRAVLCAMRFDGEAGQIVATNTHVLAGTQSKVYPSGSKSFSLDRSVVLWLGSGPVVIEVGSITTKRKRLVVRGIGVDPLEEVETNSCIHTREDLEGVVYESWSHSVPGTYPLWQRVMPSRAGRSIVLNREGLIRAIKRLGPIYRDNANRVRMGFRSDLFPEVITCVVKARSEEIGSAEEHLVTASTKGETEGYEIAFNGNYALNFLRSIESETVTIWSASSDRPLLWQGEVFGDFGVIMPMALV